MKDMIKEIVEIDKEAQRITDEAQQQKLDSTDEVLRRREEIRKENLARARKRIAKNEVTERAVAEEGWKETAAHYSAVRDTLEQAYRVNGAGWVKEIVSRCVKV